MPIYNAFFFTLQLAGSMTKQIILCADDYAQTAAISQGIIKLLEQKRLSATSCLTSSPYWPTHAHWLLPFINQADIGLHFNLTEGPALAEIPNTAKRGQFNKLSILLLKALFHRIKPAEIAVEFSHQLEQFIAAFGRLPNFIDGHQHVLHLPVIRDAILTSYQKLLKSNKTYMRSVSVDNLWQLLQGRSRLKRTIIQLTGAGTFKRELTKHKIPHNTSFAGVYNFAKAKKYSKIFPEFLKTIGNGGLVMCHPSLKSTDTSDPLYSGRHFEYEYFASEQFLLDCKAYDVQLIRFVDIL